MKNRTRNLPACSAFPQLRHLWNCSLCNGKVRCPSYTRKLMFLANKLCSINLYPRYGFTIAFCGDFFFLPTECRLFFRVPSARIFLFFLFYTIILGCNRLRHCATSRKFAGSIPDGVIGIFHWHNPSVRTMALGSTQSLTEMSTRNISWGGKGSRCLGLTTLRASCADCIKIWEPQPPGTIWATPGL